MAKWCIKEWDWPNPKALKSIHCFSIYSKSIYWKTNFILLVLIKEVSKKIVHSVNGKKKKMLCMNMWHKCFDLIYFVIYYDSMILSESDVTNFVLSTYGLSRMSWWVSSRMQSTHEQSVPRLWKQWRFRVSQSQEESILLDFYLIWGLRFDLAG